MPVVSRKGFTVRVLRAGSSTSAGLGVLVTDRYIVTCAHVVSVALGRGPLAREEPAADALVQAEFCLLGSADGAPVRSCTVRRWVSPLVSGAPGSDVAVLEITRGDLPPGAGPARMVDHDAFRHVYVDIFGYPAHPDRRGAGAWTRQVVRGVTAHGTLQLDADSSSVIEAQPGYSGSPVVVTDGDGDAVIGILSAVGNHSRDAYAVPVAELADAWPEVLGAVLMPPCPYRWLSPFTSADARQGLFVGREREVTELRHLVQAEAVVMVTGSSGVGKSSLLSAGLATALSDDGWAIAPMLPGARPVDALAWALLKLEGSSSRPSARTLQAYVRRLRSGGLADLGPTIALIAEKPVLVCIDPLDEIFNEHVCSRRNRSEFLEIVLAGAGGQAGKFHVTCALRSDLLSELLDHPDSASRMQGRIYMLSPMGRERIERVIKEPAASRGVAYDDGLVSVIAGDASSDGSLPLLEFALAELWPYQRRRRIKLDDYLQLGRVSGALGRHAERTYHELLHDYNESQIRQVLLSFVVVAASGATHAPKMKSRFTDQQQGLIDRLVAARLMVSRKADPELEDVYEIAHAAVLENWDRLRTWIDEDRKFLDWYSQMRRFNPDDLLPEPRLAEAREWLADREGDIDEDVRLLIARSHTHYEQQLRALNEARDQAEFEARRAESLRLASLSEQATVTHTSVGIALAVESLLTLHTIQGDIALRRALAHAALSYSLPGHGEPVNVIAFGRGGRFIATGDEAGVIRVFSSSGESRFSRKQPGPVDHIAFSNSDEWVIGSGRAGQVCVIESATGKQVGLIKHDDAVNFAVFSPDNLLAVAACDDGVARIFNWRTGGKVGEIVHGGPVRGALFSPDGRLVVTASDDGTSRAHALGSRGTEKYRLTHGGPVNSVAFSPAGDRLVTSSDDGSFRVFAAQDGSQQSRADLGAPAKSAIFNRSGNLIAVAGGLPGRGILRVQEVGSERPVLECHDREMLSCAAFSHDDELIVVAGQSGRVRVIEMATGAEWTAVGHDGPVSSVDFSPTERKAASASTDRSARVFSPAPGPERYRVSHKHALTHVEFVSDGDRLVSASGDGTVLISDLETGGVYRTITTESALHAVLVSHRWNSLMTAGEDGDARLFDLSTGGERFRIRHDGPVWSLAASRDGLWLATGSGDRTARVVYRLSGREDRRILCPGPVTSVDLSPDGQWLAVASGGPGEGPPSVHVYASRTGIERFALPHTAWVSQVTFSPSGNLIATAGDDGLVQVFDAVTGLRRSLLRHERRVGSVAFGDGEKWAITASDDGTARVFDPVTGAEQSRLVHDKWVNTALLFDGGKLAATASEDGTARIFDPATGIERNRLTHDYPVRAAAVSDDGEWLATASADGMVLVSAIGSASLIEAAQERMTRPLSTSEQQRYGIRSPVQLPLTESASHEEALPPSRGNARFNWFRSGDYVVVEASGELDVITRDQLWEILDGVVERGDYSVILDLRETTFIDSSAVHTILRFSRGISRWDGICKVVYKPGGLVHRHFRLTAADQLIQTYFSLEEALEG